MVAESFPQVELVRNPSNSGFAAANNLALEKVSGRYVMLLNPDAELHPHAVQRMVEFADAHPDAAVIGPKLLNSDGTLQKNGRKFPTFAREFLHITKLYRRLGEKFDRKYEWGRDDFEQTTEVDSVCGACMLVRCAAFRCSGVPCSETCSHHSPPVGLLDSRYFMYYEEDDWCRRMKQAGWKVYYFAEAQVTHHHGQASGKIGLSKMRIAYASQYLFFRKHHGLGQALLIRALSGIVLAMMLLKRKAR
jgi:hypothetical protein